MAFVESTWKTGTPEPFWIVTAVVEEIFINNPPEAVKPARKASEEFCRVMILDAWLAAACTTSVGPIRLGAAVSDFCCTSKAGAVEDAETTVVVAKVAPRARKGVEVETEKWRSTLKSWSMVEDP